MYYYYYCCYYNNLIVHHCREYSKQMFPHADQMLNYLHDYQQKLGIKVQFNTEVRNVRNSNNDSAPDGILHLLDDQNGNTYACKCVHCVCVCVYTSVCVCVWNSIFVF